jgi:hypothetical protein
MRTAAAEHSAPWFGNQPQHNAAKHGSACQVLLRICSVPVLCTRTSTCMHTPHSSKYSAKVRTTDNNVFYYQINLCRLTAAQQVIQ